MKKRQLRCVFCDKPHDSKDCFLAQNWYLDIKGKRLVTDNSSLPDNKNLAEKRLLATTSKLISSGRYSDYNSVLGSWEDEKIIEVSSCETVWYLNRFSKYSRILRLVAWILRFGYNSRYHKNKQGELSLDEIQIVEKKLLKLVQKDSFDDTVTQNKLKRINAFIDNKGLMRLKTKIVRRKDDENFRCPIALPSNNLLVERQIFENQDPEDLTPLTSAMFIQDFQTVGAPDLDNLDNVNLTKRLRYQQRLRNDLRKRFREEYLSLLVQQQINKAGSKQVEVRDVVLVGYDNKKRLNWPMGLVTEVFPGEDNSVRVLRVKTSKGELIRPV
ncbi:uncharacterized protein NPIL_348541 [Nephila pilipes]|uniref:DUF5641 domain-containing protein n=1 Tax=Nephila pilipes TaxID=299642 RepID=A0A8X6PME9_NEPPI|nr:uncharacterized protein NPIL_348541 [Nephila pilipes]